MKVERLTGSRAKEIRLARNLTQAEFWEALKITQSGGSRFEREGRRIPESVLELLLLATLPEAKAIARLVKLRKALTPRKPKPAPSPQMNRSTKNAQGKRRGVGEAEIFKDLPFGHLP